MNHQDRHDRCEYDNWLTDPIRPCANFERRSILIELHYPPKEDNHDQKPDLNGNSQAGRRDDPATRQATQGSVPRGPNEPASLFYYNVGEEVAKGRQEIVDRFGSAYGQDYIERLAAASGISLRRLYQAEGFVSLYDRAGLRRLLNSPYLTWSHVRELLREADPELRRALEKKAIKQRLTAEQLSDLITAGKRKQQQSVRPSRPLPPASPKKAIQILIDKGTKLRELFTSRMFNENYSLSIALEEIAFDRIDEELCQRVEEAVSLCETIASLSAQQAESLRTTIETLRRNMVTQAEYDLRKKAGEDQTSIERDLAKRSGAA